MAEFVMKGVDGWSYKEGDKILESEEKTDIETAHRIPVYVLYYTAWADENGRVVYGTDIYKQDRKLIEKLSNIDGFSLPGDNDLRLAGSGHSSDL